MPKISVCIPVYNRSRYIASTIRSVLNQEFVDYEIIISDNASTDDTIEIVKSFDDSRIYLHRNQKNIGMYPNFNRCINLARGDYIKFLLSDDLFITPHALAKYARVLDEHPDVGIVSSNYIPIDSKSLFLNVRSGSAFERRTDRFVKTHLKLTKGSPLVTENTIFVNNSNERIDVENCPIPDRQYPGKVILNIIYRSNTDRWILTPTHACFRRSMISKIGLFNEDIIGGWGTETEYWTRILSRSDLFRIGYPLVAFRVHAYSGTEAVFKKGSQYRDLHFYYKMIFENCKPKLTYTSRLLGPLSFQYNIIKDFLRKASKGELAYWKYIKWAFDQDILNFVLAVFAFPWLSLLKRYSRDCF